MTQKLICLLFFAAFACFSCKDDYTNWTEGEITGRDFRKCMCCGGLMFTSDLDSDFLIASYPDDVDFIKDDTVFPIKVRIEYDKNETCYDMTRSILVKKMEKR